MKTESSHILFQDKDVLIINKYKNEKVNLEEVLLFKGYSNYSYIYTINKTLLVTKTLKDIEQVIQYKVDMIRIHKSFIINRNFIKTFNNAFGKKTIVLLNDLEVEVSRRKWPVLKQLLK